MEKRRKWKKVVVVCIGAVVLFLAGFVGYLSITEYKPAEIEEL